MVVFDATLDVASRYSDGACEGMVDGKKHQVYFRIDADDGDIVSCVEEAKRNPNIVAIRYSGTADGIRPVDLTGVYVTVSRDFGSNITESDILDFRDDYQGTGVSFVIRVPESYADIHFMWDMSQKYPDVRFCGGTVFCIDGCRLGCLGRDVLAKRGIRCDESAYLHKGCSCAARVVSEVEDLHCKASKPKEKQIKQAKQATKGKKLMFRDLLYRNGRVEL